MRTDEPILGCVADELNEPNLHIFYANAAGNWQIRQALTAGMMQLKGFEPPTEIVFPIVMKDKSQDSLCVPDRPTEASISSLIPDELVAQMYPEG